MRACQGNFRTSHGALHGLWQGQSFGAAQDQARQQGIARPGRVNDSYFVRRPVSSLSVGIAPGDAITTEAYHHLLDARPVQQQCGKAGLASGLNLHAAQYRRFTLVDLEELQSGQPGPHLFTFDNRHRIHKDRDGGGLKQPSQRWWRLFPANWAKRGDRGDRGDRLRFEFILCLLLTKVRDD